MDGDHRIFIFIELYTAGCLISGGEFGNKLKRNNFLHMVLTESYFSALCERCSWKALAVML